MSSFFRLFLPLIVCTAAVELNNNTYYVKPDNSSFDCSDHPTCLTLNQYAAEQRRYFKTESSFVFLPGNHTLTTQINVTGSLNVSLEISSSQGTTTVKSLAKVGFRCENVTGFKIKGLTFLLESTAMSSSGLVLHSSSSVIVVSTVFRGKSNVTESFVYAIFAVNSSFLVASSTFSDHTGYHGGAIAAYKGSKVEISGSNFTHNKARSYGGALFVNQSDLVLKSNSSSFVGNMAKRGGAIYLAQSNATILCRTNFTRNKAKDLAGALYARTTSIVFSAGVNTFVGNEAGRCGAVSLLMSNATINSESSFIKNVAKTMGGALCVLDSSLVLQSVMSTFDGNRADHGGAIYMLYSDAVLENLTVINNAKEVIYANWTSLTLNGTNTIAFNHDLAIVVTCKRGGYLCSTAAFGGNTVIDNNEGAFLLESSDITFKKNVTISNNYRKQGQVGSSIYSNESQIFFMGYVLFINNSVSTGGVIHMKRMRNVESTGTFEFINNIGENGFTFTGGITFSGNATFRNNTATSGSILYIREGSLTFKGKTLFELNTAENGGAVKSAHVAEIKFYGTTSFINNTANEYGGALHIGGAIVLFAGTLVFTSNTAKRGGAVYTIPPTIISIHASATILSSHNHAFEFGGVLYYADNAVALVQCEYFNRTNFELLPFCFIDLEGGSPPIVKINSYNDSAGIDGSFIYGGLLDKCKLGRTLALYNSPNYVLDLLTTNVTSANVSKVIGSEPFQLHFCEESNFFDASSRSKAVTVYRGQTFSVSVLSLSQGQRLTSAVVSAVVSNNARLELSQTTHAVPNHCSQLEYNLYSTQSYEIMTLYVDGPCQDTGLAEVTINVTLLKCPDGFTQRKEECVCEERLQTFDVNCTVGKEIFITKRAASNFWVSTLYDNGSYLGLILYRSCPMEYCKTDTVHVPLTDLDQQCDHNRSGLLCGSCSTNYSLMLGGSRCGVCTNSFLALLLAFIAAGIALVALLIFSKLTVATGMINGVILYANFVQINRKIFFPINTTNVLTVYIAWLNLDVEFETCFYEGMNAYWQTWLQFVFPLYLWLLMSLIVVASRYSVTLTKIIGSNPIAVLATLLLMSYTKILRIIIEVFSSVNLEYPEGREVTVWLKDANVPHLQGKHLALTVFTSLFLIFVFIPYTLFLLLSRRLYRIPNRAFLRWLVKFKPLLDSYTAPYKRNTYYWTGFLLVVRCALYIVFSINSLGDTKKSLLAIIVTFSGIAMLASGRIYRDVYTNIIESSMYFNLIVLSAGTLADTNKVLLSSTLVGIVFATTAGIIVYHFYLHYIVKSAAWRKCQFALTAVKNRLRVATPAQLAPQPEAMPPPPLPPQVTSTEIDLREPLMATN